MIDFDRLDRPCVLVLKSEVPYINIECKPRKKLTLSARNKLTFSDLSHRFRHARSEVQFKKISKLFINSSTKIHLLFAQKQLEYWNAEELIGPSCTMTNYVQRSFFHRDWLKLGILSSNWLNVRGPKLYPSKAEELSGSTWNQLGWTCPTTSLTNEWVIAMIPGPQMNPDRKWSPNWTEMIPDGHPGPEMIAILDRNSPFHG